jgi:hypothetical protein
MRRGVKVAAALVPAFLVVGTGCGASGGDAAPIVVEPAIVPTEATVAVASSALTYSSDAAISPSGAARVAPTGDGEWCLEDASGVRCVDAESLDSAAHGVVWRPDETAIAVTDGYPISVIDFAAGTSVETDLENHRLLAWSPDGSELLGLAIDRPSELVRLDPVTLEADGFVDLDGPLVPQLFWPNPDVVWGSNPHGPKVYTVADGDDPVVIPGGFSTQLLVSVTADGRLALGIDDDLFHGVPGPGYSILTLFDRGVDGGEARSVGVQHPPFIGDDAPQAAQLSRDGRVLMVLYDVDGGSALASAVVDGETLATSGWTELARWDSGDAQAPARYASNGLLRWDGGDTAWIIAESGELLAVALSG